MVYVRVCNLEKNQYSSDSPIFLQEMDKFNRYPFSQRVAEVIANRKDSNNMIIGIYGKWGYGKTSVLNFIQNELHQDSNIVTLSFNPWRFSNEDQLLVGFFNDLAKAIDKSLSNGSEKAGDLISKYLIPITTLAGKDTWFRKLKSLISEPETAELRKRIEALICSEGKRIVVLIDDIDRLTISEIQAVFRMIKLTAGFKYLTYVVAFDKNMVVSALEEKYGKDSGNIGGSFLEKIIQVPLQLPKIHDSDLRLFCFSEIDNIININDIELSTEDANNFTSVFTGSLEYFLTTPRQVKLYSNVLLFSIPILLNEVSLIDLMLIEGIHVLLPNLYEFIRDRKDIFLDISTLTAGTQKELNDFTKQALDFNLKNYTQIEKNRIINLLTYLFPKLYSIYNKIEYNIINELEWSKNKRICSRDYFEKYFSYSIPSNDISDAYIEDLIKKSDISTFEVFTSKIRAILEEGKSESLIKKLRLLYSNFTLVQTKQVVLSIATLSDLLPNPLQFFYQANPFHQASFLIGQCIENLASVEHRTYLARQVISLSTSIAFAVECVINFPKNTEEKPNPNGFIEEALTELEIQLSNRISSEFIDHKEFTIHESNSIPQVLYYWMEYGDKFDMNKQLQSLFDNNPEAVFRIIDSYTPIGSSSKGVSRSEFRKNSYDSLTNTIDPLIVKKAIISIYDDLPLDESFPAYIEDERKRKLARQYMWFHRSNGEKDLKVTK